jgi:uncharacterized protein
MQSFLLIENNEDYYLVSFRHKMVLNVSEVLYHIIDLVEIKQKQQDIFRLIQKDVRTEVSRKDFQIQFKKYRLLQENLYFEPFPKPRFNCTVTAKEIEGKWKEREVHLLLEPTFACNLSCSYCCYGKYYEAASREDKIMKPDIAIKAIDFVVNRCRGAVTLFYISFYGGEALLNFSLIQKVVRYCDQLANELKLTFQYTITTNGVLLDRYMDYLVQHKFKIGISIDGDQYNDSFRVFHDLQESYPLVVKNITRLKEEYPDFYAKYVNFQTVRHNRNKDVELEKYFQETFQKTTTVSDVMQENLCDSYKDEFYQVIADRNLPAFSNPLYKVRAYYNYVYTTPFFWVDYDPDPNRKPSSTCLPFQVKLFVTSDGEILPCEQIGSGYNFARMDQSDVYMDFEKLAKRYTGYFKKIEKNCCTCYRHRDCMECMFTAGITKPEYEQCPEYLGINELNQTFTDMIQKYEKNILP